MIFQKTSWGEITVVSKYLNNFPKPLLEDLVKSNWLPVIGAGMSLNAVLPQSKRMPLWPELGKSFADELQDYTSSSALDGISAYEHEFGRARLIERLSALLHINESQPGPAHREFCSLPFDIVCTTNFDFLLEKQYDSERQINRTVHPVVDEDQLSINIGSKSTVLLKLHGDIRHPSRLILTETDYDGFLNNYPLIATYLSNLLITKTVVLIGYSLDDPDFRQIWHVVASRLGKSRRMAYAIMVGAKPGDVARFARRGVKVINLPGTRENYGKVLADAFSELREYRRENAGKTLQVTEEAPLEQLLLPRGAMTRLCLFSTPLELLPFYRENVFPIAEAAGFVPVTAADVIHTGDSISAKIDTLIDRAAVMVVDATSPNTQFELGLALGRAQETEIKPGRGRLKVVLIAPKNSEFSFSKSQYDFIERPELVKENSDFLKTLSVILHNLSDEMGIKFSSEPRRLLNSNEYRAAVISAMTLLETALRNRLIETKGDILQRHFTMRHLLDAARKIGLIDNEYETLLSWRSIRNEAVHTNKALSKKDATPIVDGVENIIRRISIA